MDTIKDITIPCQPILTAVLRPCSKWGLLATVRASAATEMCNGAKLSWPCPKKQTRLSVTRQRGCVGGVKHWRAPVSVGS